MLSRSKMKSTFLTLLFLCTFALSFGQIEFGPKAGYNQVFVSFSASNAPEVSGNGFNSGVFLQKDLTDKLYVGGEFLLSLRTYNEELSFDETVDNIRVRSESFVYRAPLYLDIPVFVKYAMNLSASRYSSDKLLSFYAGPQASIYMTGSGSSHETTIVELLDQITVEPTDVDFTKPELKEYFSPFHMGILAGVQFSLSAGLNFDLRVTRSLISTNRNNAMDEYGKVNNTLLQFTVGYNIFGSKY